MSVRLSARFWQILLSGVLGLVCLLVLSYRFTARGQSPASSNDPIDLNAETMVTQGRHTFRFDTFGDEAYWGGQLRLHQAVTGLSPRAALGLGLKVDVDALPQQLVDGIRTGTVNLGSPATTLALLGMNAVVGLTGFFDASGQLTSIGIH
jgi:hypothetical protein